ncbi:hypothetical protein EIN_312860 [Entamoeba invadens IP1]|uniref:Importin N-terminal domain-containing protein n=1 Tax=Entamoeba invadens IP1 TaxID=370355 RepID=A0A0A1UCL9_ENTIV|nr:hypothetical protein EIN_312860 [Entamoeba invadens IP1]ELP92914.1 hypothetical protein EIN_312860 [Entamoeba invadens IP1]|eukprot:XP_004259685.1 hypothetical protein EIN_312860 [Entamoeba invadens IP1]
MEQFVQAIVATQNPQLRAQAELQLSQFQQSNPQQYMLTLLQVISDKAQNVGVRQIAGLIFKNLFKNRANSQTMADKWIAMNDQIRQMTHTALLGLLVEPDMNIQNLGANIISNIAVIDLKTQRWPDLINFLTVDPTLPKLKAISNIIEDADYPTAEPLFNPVVMLCFKIVSVSVETCVAVLDIIDHIFNFKKVTDDPAKRNQLLQLVLSAVKQNNNDIILKSFQVINTFVDFCFANFSEIEGVMVEVSQKILGLPCTPQVLDVQKTVLNLWETVAKNELDQTTQTRSVIQPVFPLLSQQIIAMIASVPSPTEDIDENDVCFVSQDTLATMVKCVGPSVLTQMSNTIGALYTNPNWQIRFQAMSVFASLLVESGIKPEVISSHVLALGQLLNDQVPINRATSVYVISKVIKFYPDYFGRSEIIGITNKMFSMFGDVEIVTHAIAIFFSGLGSIERLSSYVFSQDFAGKVIHALLDATSKSRNLSMSTLFLTSVSDILKGSKNKGLCIEMDKFLLSSMQSVLFQNPEFLGYTVLVLESCLMNFGDDLMNNPQLVNMHMGIAIQSFNVCPEPALILLDFLVATLKENIKPMFNTLIGKVIEWSRIEMRPDVFLSYILLVGDMALSAQSEFEKYCGDFVGLFLNALLNPEFEITQKNQITEIIGDLIVVGCQNVASQIKNIIGVMYQLIRAETIETKESQMLSAQSKCAALYVLAVILQQFKNAEPLTELIGGMLEAIYYIIKNQHFGEDFSLVSSVTGTLYDIFDFKFVTNSPLILNEVKSGNIFQALTRIKSVSVSNDQKVYENNKILSAIEKKIKHAFNI